MGYKKTFLVGLSVLFISCGEPPPAKETPLNEKFGFNKEEYVRQIESVFNSGDKTVFPDSMEIHEIDLLSGFYRNRGFKPLVLTSFEDTNRFYSLEEMLKDAHSHGLNPSEYNAYKTPNYFSHAIIADSIATSRRHRELARTEISLAASLIKFAWHLKYGRINPYSVYDDGYNLPVRDSSSRNLLEPLQAEDIWWYFIQLDFKEKRYSELRHSITFYRNLSQIEWKKIPYITKKLKVGDSDVNLPHIAEKLLQFEYLDTTGIDINLYWVYDSLLINALLRFQEERGLLPDGVPGKSTIDWLNLPPAEYIKKIKLSLERFRWTTYTDSSDYLLVNIPAFTLYLHEDGKIVNRIKVCTGKKRARYYREQLARYKRTGRYRDRPDNWETPQLYSQVSHAILNPTWTVPPSIIREEIYYEFKKDTTYLQRRKFKVYLDNKEVDLNEVDLRQFSPEHIPYSIVQSPDPYNALGKLKFIFSNKFGVYLHDTPTRAPFEYANRAVSHGCIRVEKPYELAAYFLKDHSSWNIDYVKIETKQKIQDKSLIDEYYAKRKQLRYANNGDKTTTIKLDKRISLFIDYYTAWVDEKGRTQFRDDVYGKDEMLNSVLKY